MLRMLTYFHDQIRFFLDQKLQLGHEKDGIAGRSSVRLKKGL